MVSMVEQFAFYLLFPMNIFFLVESIEVKDQAKSSNDDASTSKKEPSNRSESNFKNVAILPLPLFQIALFPVLLSISF